VIITAIAIATLVWVSPILWPFSVFACVGGLAFFELRRRHGDAVEGDAAPGYRSIATGTSHGIAIDSSGEVITCGSYEVADHESDPKG
jgi:hypothetical protein